ncbi:hypothetical protein KKH56_04500 [bacterium]|nr:hypothetical protein [bacterium]
MSLIYLDYNCFQRGFDDQRQIRIQMEALACQEIFNRAERRELQLVWSFMHKDETILCPFPERKIEVFRLSNLCEKRVCPNEEIYNYAMSFQTGANLSAKDAVHLACASYTKAKFFLTCDDEVIKRAKRLSLDIRIINPVDYIREEDKLK